MKLYRALLRLYPASFRAEYEDEMAAVVARGGSPGFVAAVADVLPNALHAHADLLRQDLRYAARSLRRSPGFAVTAILVAALGIGATTATFSITDHVLVRPLPFPDGRRLVKIWQDESGRGVWRNEASPAVFRDWQRMTRSYQSMGAFFPRSVNLQSEGEPRRLTIAMVSAGFFPTLSRGASLGRAFEAADDREGAAGTLVLSDRLWRNQFAADAGILGKKVLLDGAPHEVIGVMPADFNFPSRDTELWTPLKLKEQDYEDRSNTYIQVVARLKPGVSLGEAQAEMRVIAEQLVSAYPQDRFRHDAWVNLLRDELSPRARLLLRVLFLAAIGLLLIACTNLASLLMARSLARRREFAVRTALGAGRERLVRQMLTESLVLALCGGLLGIGLALAATPLIVRLVPNSLPISQAPHADLRLLLIASLLTAATGVGFGVVPALKACRETDTDALAEGSRTGSGRPTERLRGILVIVEVTASVALLVASGLLIRALWKLQHMDPGFKAEGVLTLRTTLPQPKYEKTDRRVALYRTVLAQVRALPGVESAAFVTGLPMVRRGGIWSALPEGEPDENETQPGAAPYRQRSVSMRYVTPGYFRTMGVPLRSGRDVQESDTLNAPLVAVVSESLIRQTWPGEKNALGRRIKTVLEMRTVVGVVGDVRVRGFEESSEPQVYLPDRQVNDGDIISYVPEALVVRSSAPQSLLPSIRRIVAAADPELPISDVRMLTDVVDADTAPRAVQVRILGGFALAALVLAGIGIHGLLALVVSQRTREIGVRMALGARWGEILGMVLKRGVLLAGAGAALGLALALAAGRAMQSLLAGVSPADGATLAASAGLAIAMTLLGSLLPAVRAVRVDPAKVLRSE